MHPRIGAADVVPIVPIRAGGRTARAAAALKLARRVGEELELPVFLYADVGDGRGPAFFRRGGPEELQRRIDAGELAPDFGPPRLHPSAGGVILGARRPLIAFNVNLAGATVEIAQEIARVVRERDGGFPGVRALGLDLPSTGQAQVSMNVEDWEASALHEIVEAIEREAAARGVEVAGSELVGLMPAGAAAAAAGAVLRIDGFDASRLSRAAAARSRHRPGAGRERSVMRYRDSPLARGRAESVPSRVDRRRATASPVTISRSRMCGPSRSSARPPALRCRPREDARRARARRARGARHRRSTRTASTPASAASSTARSRRS